MPVVRVINPGVQTTVQDLGRPGHASIGVPRGGAADSLSLRVANRLVGNPERAAGLEIALMGPTLRFEQPAVVCLAGAPSPPPAATRSAATPRRGRPLIPLVPTVLAAGERVRVGPIRAGARAYLAIGGGVRTPPVLGSRSVHVPSGLGGGPLAAGDAIPVGLYRPGLRVSPLDRELKTEIETRLARRTLRVVGPSEARAQDPPCLEALLASPWRIEPRSDRTGVRLDGTAVAVVPGDDHGPSAGVVPGTVQLPPSGSPIVLGPDGPTVGGYPALGAVIAADLPALGQCRPGDRVRFEPIGLDGAREADHQLERLIASVPRAYAPPHVLCDTGEADPGPGRDAERAMFEHVTAVAIACGGHAGNERSMREAVEGALEHDRVIGAHPSYPDRDGFGRRAIEIDRRDLLGSLRAQLAALERVCRGLGGEVMFVKPHGALYHAVSHDAGLARAFAALVFETHPDAALVAAAGSAALGVWGAMRAEAWAEVFADRGYGPDGRLLGRGSPGALLTRPDAAAAQAIGLAGPRSHGARAVCVHGDTPNAAAIAAAVRAALRSTRLP